MSQINKLTKAQEKLLPIYRDKWINIGLSTQAANRKEAEAAIIRSYELAALSPPKKIIWCGSPLSQGLVRAIILDKKLIENIGTSVRASVGNSVWASVRASVGNSVWDSVGASVRASVGNSVWDSVGASVGNSVWDSVGDSVRASVGNSVWDSVGASGYGQHDANWLGFYEFFRSELNLKDQTEKISALIELAKHAGWYLPHQNICWVSERHCILNRDNQGRIHSLIEPAIAYPDGWAIYAIHGVRVPEYIILRPQEISIEKIEAEKNAEIRRVMIDRFGLQNYIQNCGAKLIHKDSFGELFRKEQENDEPLQMIKVINSTPEPDGTFKNYFLRVPPDMTTAHDAIAWTFGLNKKEYQPRIET